MKKAKSRNNDNISRALLNDLYKVAEKLGYEVRIEKGDFSSGQCLINSRKIIILREDLSVKDKLRVIAKIIAPETGGMFVPPALREFLDKD